MFIQVAHGLAPRIVCILFKKVAYRCTHFQPKRFAQKLTKNREKQAFSLVLLTFWCFERTYTDLV